MIKCILSIVIFLIPVIGMVAGLALSTLIPIFWVVLLISIKDRLRYRITLLDWKLELLFLVWCFLSCLWSINSASSLIMYSQLVLIILIGFTVNNYIDKLAIERPLAIGIAGAIILFLVEYFSQGILSRTFRTIFQPNSWQHFYLYMLDRGCALLSIISWPMIGILIHYNKHLLTLLFYIFILFLLYISDSLSAFLGFTIGGIVFIISRLLATQFHRSTFFKLGK